MHKIELTEHGRIMPNAAAILRAQKAFSGAAEAMGVTGEDDTQRLVDDIRHGDA